MMLSVRPFLTGALVALFVTQAAAVDQTVNPHLDDETKLAPTNYDKITKLFPNDTDWIYDFTTNKFYNFAPGGVSNANAATFPAMTRLGMTLAILNLGPCSMLPPHYHPRATNVVVAIAGTTHTYMLNENGVPIIEEVLTPMKMTIFPQGSMHMMYNAGCTNAQLVSALNSDDAGTNNIFNSVLQFPADYLQALLGQGFDVDATTARLPAVGTGANWGAADCRTRCGFSGPGSYGSTGVNNSTP